VELRTNREERLAPGSRLVAGGPERRWLEVGRSVPMPLAKRSVRSGVPRRWRVGFQGVRSREEAEALRDLPLLAPALEEHGTLWAHELVGAEVKDREGRRFGRVIALEANPASDLLVLEGGGLVPLRFVVRAVPGLVEVDVPPGLLG
jgi:ribosomal 30S subunit maturation factor RimM